MAEKLRDGISRELRYMEYKLRKRKSDKKKKNNLNPGMNDPDNNLSGELRQAVPSNRGEEDLQLQVALAVSREEAKDQEKSQISDKIRLEMALKESAEVAAKVVAKTSPTHSPTAVNGQATDPWGAPITETKPNTFDPFAFDKPANQPSTNGFNSDAWGAPPANMSNASAPQTSTAADPWGNKTLAPSAGLLPPPGKSPGKKADPWGSGQTETTPVDPWNAGAPAVNNNTPANDLWDTSIPSSSTAVTQVNNQPNHSATFNPFSVQNGSAFPPNQTFDPLQDFDNLSIQPAHNQQPVSSYASGGLLSADVMMPQPAYSALMADPLDLNDNKVSNSQSGSKAGSFLGENASLVNIESLVAKPASNHPYITMNTSTTGAIGGNRNPFNQKGPSVSMNQMKGSNQTTFPGQLTKPNVQPTIGTFPTTMQPNPMSMPTMGMQPTYGASGMMMGSPFGAPQAVQTNMFAQQQNQSLF